MNRLRAEDPWDATKAVFERDLRRAVERATWDELRAAAPAMARFARPEDLLTVVQDRAAEPAVTNAVLTELAVLAQTGRRVAFTLLCLALWPGLSAIRARWLRTYRGRDAELAADIGSTFVLAVGGLNLSKPKRVAATLCRSTQRELARAYRRRPCQARPLPPVQDLTAGGAELLEVHEWLTHETGPDAELILRIILWGEPTGQAADAVGLTVTTAWQRFHRLSLRLREAFRELDNSQDAA